jgi:hypothetical protein
MDIQLCQQMGDTSGECIAIHNGGRIFLLKGDYVKALDYFDQHEGIRNT